LNLLILNHASVQANTLPSGHVSGAMAAALALLPIAPALGWVGIGVATLIAVAAVAARYHYLVDCVAGVAVALVVFMLT
jgi:membrane-associated phospholipid phosphatase